MPPTPPTDLSLDDPIMIDWITAATGVLQQANTSTCVIGAEALFSNTEPLVVVLSAILVPTEHAQRSCQAMTSLHREIIEGSRLLRNR